MFRLGWFVILLWSCGPKLARLQVPAGCQPLLGEAECFLPYPSDFFRVPDANQPSGYAVRIGEAALPRSKMGPFDVSAENPIDGFSSVPTIVATLGVELQSTGFAPLEDAQESLSGSTSNTLLLEAPSFAPVAHWVDVDRRTTDFARQAFILHPLAPLKENTRYVVLVKGVLSVSGDVVPAPEGFRRLREGISEPALAALAKSFAAEVAPAARAADVPISSLQLGWSFTTGTKAWATRDLLEIRRQTLAWLDTNQSAVQVTSPLDARAADAFRVVRGTFTAPRFCSTEAKPGCRLMRGADGQVMHLGVVQAPFVAVIPQTVEAATGASGVFLFGHGFFGNLSETEGEAARRIASQAKRTLVATEWWGMHISDVGLLAEVLSTRPAQAARFTERVHQGMANWLVLTRLAEQFGQLPAFQRPSGESLVVGPADSFMGISQGHILGGTMTALNPTVTKVVLNVGGAGLSHMMLRAEPFAPLFELLTLAVPDPLEQRKFVAAVQRPFDRIDPATYASFLLREPLLGDAPKQVLMHMGLMDASVPNLGSFLHARAIGLPLLTPSPVSVSGLESRGYPAQSGLQVHDFQLGDVNAFYRESDFPKMKTKVHDSLRELPAVVRQVELFFRDGSIVQTCEGTCNPE
jgi:hypothetical protein